MSQLIQGLDVPRIKLVIQWGLTCGLDMLDQRIGRAAREPDCEAAGIVFVELNFLDSEQKRVQDSTGAGKASKRQKTLAGHTQTSAGSGAPKKSDDTTLKLVTLSSLTKTQRERIDNATLDLVNAGLPTRPHLKCRRKVKKKYLHLPNRGMSIAPSEICTSC